MRLTNGDVVVIVDHNQVSELQVTGGRGSLGGDTLLSATITEESVGVVVNEVVAGLVEDGGSVCLGNSETNGVSETLTERAGGDFNSGGIVSLGVTGGDGIESLWIVSM